MINSETSPAAMDAERAEKAGAVAVHMNTAGRCHLDAGMVRDAMDCLPLREIDLLLIENVGNLVCPASWRLGSHWDVLIASTPEGDDKPYKYPKMYGGVDALVINKTDLLPYVSFDIDYFTREESRPSTAECSRSRSRAVRELDQSLVGMGRIAGCNRRRRFAAERPGLHIREEPSDLDAGDRI